MATKVYYFRGTCKYAKVYEPDENFDKKTKSYKINMYLDDASWDLFDQSGIQLEKRLDKNEDTRYVIFKRAEFMMRKGNYEKLDPPSVINNDGESITDLIGNGSTVVCKVTVYDTLRGKGHRLEAVKVETLVPYDKVEVNTLDGLAPF